MIKKPLTASVFRFSICPGVCLPTHFTNLVEFRTLNKTVKKRNLLYKIVTQRAIPYQTYNLWEFNIDPHQTFNALECINLLYTWYNHLLKFIVTVIIILHNSKDCVHKFLLLLIIINRYYFSFLDVKCLQYFEEYKLGKNETEVVELKGKFMFYLGIFSQVPNFVMSGINTFCQCGGYVFFFWNF